MKNTNLAIIFDLDGTLWDSTGCACDIWNRVLEKHADISFRMTKEKAEQLMGKTMEDIGKILLLLSPQSISETPREMKRQPVLQEFHSSMRSTDLEKRYRRTQ